MADFLEARCPHCRARVRINDRVHLGTKIPCPLCAQPFLVQNQLLPSAESAADEESGDEFGRQTLSSPTSRSKARKKKKGRKKQASTRFLKVASLVTLPLVAVAGVVWGIWLLWGKLHKELDLAWLPPDANVITVERLSAEWDVRVKSGAFGNVNPQDILRIERQSWGVNAKDIESVTRGANSNGDAIRVVRSTIELSPQKILQQAPEHEEVAHQGERYFRFDGKALFFPDARTAVCGAEDAVRKAIERGPKPVRRRNLDFVDTRFRRFTITIAPPADPVTPTTTVIGKHLSATVGRGLVQQKFRNEAEATAAFDAAKEELDKRRTEWNTGGRKRAGNLYLRDAALGESTIVDDEIEDQLDADESLLKSIAITRKGDLVHYTYSWQVSAFEKRQLAEALDKSKAGAAAFSHRFGKQLFLDPVTIDQPDWPLTTRIDRKAPLGKVHEPSVATDGVTVIDVHYESYSKLGSAKAEILTALGRVPGVDKSKIVTDIRNRRVVVCSVPDGDLETGSVIKALTRAGFRLVTAKTKKSPQRSPPRG